MYCNKCGTKIDDDAVFCTSCGSRVKKVNQNEEFQENIPLTFEDNNKNESEIPEKNKENNKSKKFIVSGIVAAFVIVAALLFIKQKNTNGFVDGCQDINFNNGARFAYDSANLYFIGTYNDNDDETSVYSTTYNETNKTLISDDENIIRIRLVNKRIVYLKSNDETYTIGQINTDGSNEKNIVELPSIPSKYDGDKDTLYYLLDSELHTCNWQGEEDTSILSKVDTFTLSGKNIYYASEGFLYKYDIIKKDSVELCKAKEAKELAVVNGMLYFSDANGLYNIPVNGKGTVSNIVKDKSLAKYVICDDAVYYKQELSTEDYVALAKYMAEDEEDIFSYGLVLLSVGQLCRADKSGGDGEIVETEQILLHDLYKYPEGFYCRISALSNEVEKVELK